MDSITQNSRNTKRYLPHDIKTKENAVKTYLNNGDIEYTCRKISYIKNFIMEMGKKNMMEQEKVLKIRATSQKRAIQNHIPIKK